MKKNMQGYTPNNYDEKAHISEFDEIEYEDYALEEQEVEIGEENYYEFEFEDSKDEWFEEYSIDPYEEEKQIIAIKNKDQKIAKEEDEHLLSDEVFRDLWKYNNYIVNVYKRELYYNETEKHKGEQRLQNDIISVREKNDQDAITRLFNGHMYICFRAFNSITARYKSDIPRDDYYNEVLLRVWSKIPTFKEVKEGSEEKRNYGQFVNNQTRYAIKNIFAENMSKKVRYIKRNGEEQHIGTGTFWQVHQCYKYEQEMIKEQGPGYILTPEKYSTVLIEIDREKGIITTPVDEKTEIKYEKHARKLIKYKNQISDSFIPNISLEATRDANGEDKRTNEDFIPVDDYVESNALNGLCGDVEIPRQVEERDLVKAIEAELYELNNYELTADEMKVARFLVESLIQMEKMRQDGIFGTVEEYKKVWRKKQAEYREENKLKESAYDEIKRKIKRKKAIYDEKKSAKVMITNGTVFPVNDQRKLTMEDIMSIFVNTMETSINIRAIEEYFNEKSGKTKQHFELISNTLAKINAIESDMTSISETTEAQRRMIIVAGFETKASCQLIDEVIGLAGLGRLYSRLISDCSLIVAYNNGLSFEEWQMLYKETKQVLAKEVMNRGLSLNATWIKGNKNIERIGKADNNNRQKQNVWFQEVKTKSDGFLNLDNISKELDSIEKFESKLIEDSRTITTTLKNEVEEIKGCSNYDEVKDKFLSFVRRNSAKFVCLRQRTMRILWEALQDYIKYNKKALMMGDKTGQESSVTLEGNIKSETFANEMLSYYGHKVLKVGDLTTRPKDFAKKIEIMFNGEGYLDRMSFILVFCFLKHRKNKTNVMDKGAFNRRLMQAGFSLLGENDNDIDNVIFNMMNATEDRRKKYRITLERIADVKNARLNLDDRRAGNKTKETYIPND